MKFICVQPRLIYYAWQVEVMLNNFIKHGINPSDIHILISYSSNPLDKTNNLAEKLSFKALCKHFPDVNFFYYEDTRKNPCYVSSLRPNVLYSHFSLHPELSNEVIFYHDCDMVFTQPVDFSHLIEGEDWYASDTRSYIGAKYVLSKEKGIYDKMCDIVGINRDIPIQEENNSGGAQYIIKNVTPHFWKKVENDCENLYKLFLEEEKFYDLKEYHPIQKWTADMWALLWNVWYFKHSIKIHPDLSFGWATDVVDAWYEKKIFHNAGVVAPDNKYFFKSKYINTLPYFTNDIVDPKYCSYKYFQEVQETANKSCLT
jgi:hypothetical protein